MTNTDKQRKRLISLLEELFQLDQPDLDFGFYKIMHAKAETVSNFIQNDLLKVIQVAFGKVDEEKIEQALLKYKEAFQKAKSYGAPNPEAAEAVQKAKAHYDNIKDSKANEGDTYDHLYRFFERYYDNADFMSRRYFVRETKGKAAPYAIPYDGSEVHFHWANRDQYYIKTSEYLTNFTFDIAKHWRTKEERALNSIPETLILHCRLVEAGEGEHNNNKTSDKSERFFLIHKKQPLVMENGDLVLQFEYRPDNDKPNGTQTKIWQREKIDEAEKTILHTLTSISEAKTYNQVLHLEIGENKNKRTLLRKYLNQYTKRNTTDYFIHKDLGSFLKRELDFYIKNEVMHLDDIEDADVPYVETYLRKIQVLRKIANQLITFLAQLEDFQKKLWLKKKFVTDTQYCITLDRIPESFYTEIAKNEAQRKQWVDLFAIDEIRADLTGKVDYSEPLTPDFLKANPFLMLDTALFPSEFKDALLAEIENIDESLNGLLIHSENFQALGLMQKKYHEKIDAVYIDPPYNTGPSEIAYKNNYKNSSWLSLMYNRMQTSTALINKHACYAIAIDDFELANLCQVVDDNFELYDRNMVVVNHHPQGGMSINISRTHEYMLLMTPMGLDILEGKKKSGEVEYRSYMLSGPGENKSREGRPNSFYAILIDEQKNKIVGFEKPPLLTGNYPVKKTPEGYIRKYPINPNGEEKVWCRSFPSAQKGLRDNKIVITESGIIKLAVNTCGRRYSLMSNWTDSRYNAGPHGTALVANIIGNREAFSYPKSIYTVTDAVEAMTHKYPTPLILDYFAGSGTTGHAVINLNREDGGKRKYIMVEMGNYFDTVTKPRMQKVVYSKDWKNGKPVSREGVSHAFKYIRLESYEDTLNNLVFPENSTREEAKNDKFRHGYMLNYWLDFETKGSPSLLNIQQFDDPTAYKLNLKKPDSSEYKEKNIDLVETFNWLLGLHVDYLDQWHSFTGKFKREKDEELPDTKDADTRLILDGHIKEAENGKWLFRAVEGRVCRTPSNMDDIERVLVIWRKLTDDLEQDNLMLDEWFKHYRSSKQNTEFDIIYVNGSCNLANQQRDDERWNVRLIEETFHQNMWNIRQG